MSRGLRYAAQSDVGLIRAGNEDSGFAGPRLLAIADGMGGPAAGEVASAVAIATISQLDADEPGADLLTVLRGATLAANGEVSDMIAGDMMLDGMGTTLTALLFAGGRVAVAHVGDSRAYLLRDGELVQITHDHTLVQSLIDDGRLSEDEASSHPQRSLITRAVDGRGDLEPDLMIREARVGDRYLLCSDGLSGVVSRDTIASTLAEGTPEEAVGTLVRLALRGGGPDNITAIVADLVDDAAPSVPVVLGAAAESGQGRPRAEPDTSSAAGRAAAVARSADPGQEPEPEPAPHRRRPAEVLKGLGKGVLVSASLVGVLALIVLGGWLYARSQYFVGLNTSNQVTVFRGVSGSVAGVSLSTEDVTSDLTAAELTPAMRSSVEQGIDATSRSDALQILQRLKDRVEADPQPQPGVSPFTSTPVPIPSDSPSPSVSGSPAPGLPPLVTPTQSP